MRADYELSQERGSDGDQLPKNEWSATSKRAIGYGRMFRIKRHLMGNKWRVLQGLEGLLDDRGECCEGV